MEEFPTVLDLAEKPAARQRLAQDQPAQLHREIGAPGEAAGLLVQVREVKAPAPGLPSGMFAGYA